MVTLRVTAANLAAARRRAYAADKTMMVFGDTKKLVEAIVKAVE